MGLKILLLYKTLCINVPAVECVLEVVEEVLLSVGVVVDAVIVTADDVMVVVVAPVVVDVVAEVVLMGSVKLNPILTMNGNFDFRHMSFNNVASTKFTY